ncbi:MAG: cupin-like domain-containing protein, partial [Myxococcales bacterium]|nr:cupin-like domain-containing protein [Myxococcales bacterium]
SRWGAWWRDRPSHHRDMPLTELLTLAQEGSGDGTYAVGHNRLFEALPALLDDVRVLPGQERIVHPSLWIGPAGTLTPLHFDPGSAWLVQRAGQKRVHLASPLEHGLLETAIDGSYNSVRPSALSDEERAARGFTTVELGPDDALWIPATWWHEVASLTPSISVRTAGFRWPDDLAHHVFV